MSNTLMTADGVKEGWNSIGGVKRAENKSGKFFETTEVQLTMVTKFLFILVEMSLNSQEFLAISILQ